MKTISQLTDFYYKKLYPSLQDLENDRKRLKKKILTIASIYTLVVAILCFYFKDIFTADIDLVFFLVGAYVAIGAIIYKLLIKDYTKEFKDKIIRPLIHAIDEKLLYTSDLHIPQHTIEKSKLFNSSIDRLNGNDLVRGNIDGINIEFSDIHAEHKHRSSKDNDKWETIFKGLFIVANFNKNFYGSTMVLPDVAQKAFGNLIGNFLQSHNFARDNLVKMDNSNFEKKFVVYSDDQIEARYILTHSLMDRLLAFEKKTKHPIHVSFVGNNIHLAIEYNKDLFEPSIFRSLLDYKLAMEYIKTLHLAIGIVKELKLNEKLWSKQ